MTTIINGGRLETTGWNGGDVRLRGGEFQFSNTRNNIYLDSDSVLISQSFGRSLLGGSLIGPGDLIVRGEADRRLFAGVYLQSPSDEFTGNVRVEGGMLTLAANRAVGDAAITVEAGGILMLQGANENTPTIVSNPISLRGGTLTSWQTSSSSDPLWQTNQVLGDVTVSETSFIGALNSSIEQNGLTFLGDLTLADGVSVLGRSDSRIRQRTIASSGASVEVAGDLLVGVDTDWNVLATTLAVTGTIQTAGAGDGSIDFRGSTEQIDLSNATLVAPNGGTLAVLINGESPTLSLDGPSAGLAGPGTFVGGFKISSGATISPGAPIGKLTIEGDLAIKEGSIYEVEIDGLMSDSLDVTGVLDFSVSPMDFWILRITTLSDTPPTSGEWKITSAGSITGFDPDRVRFESADGLLPKGLSITNRDDELYLILILEPQAGVLALLSLSSLFARKQTLGNGVITTPVLP